MENFISSKLTNTAIKSYQYFENDNLTEIIIPEGIRTIDDCAFAKCKNLKKIVLPNSLEIIRSNAFHECINLEEIILPTGLKEIEFRAFSDCRKLKKIIIPDSVSEIKWAAFSGCYSLEEVIFPKEIDEVGKQLFLNCKNLKKVILPNNIESLPDEFFKGCKKLDIKLDKDITKLGNRVFEDCYKLTTFPESVLEFGKNCFRNCRNLTSVNLNQNIESLSDGLFDGCTNLVNINSQKKLNIGKRCFRNCKSLTEIPSFVNNFNERAFENCTSITKINVIDKKIPFACFRGCKNLKEISNQEDIYSMGSFAFSGCESIQNFDIYNLRTIPAEAFSNCKRLKKVRLVIGISSIESRAFYNCQNLLDINLPDTIEVIKKEAFSGCNSITSITIPGNLKSFGDKAFSYMDSLEHIYVSPYNKTFTTPDNKILIHYMQQNLVLYASGIKDKTYSLKEYNIEYDVFGRCMIKPINGIGKYAFAGAGNLEELTICSCTQNIEATAFYGCQNLKKLNIEAISLFPQVAFNIRNNRGYYFDEITKEKSHIPFEEVTFSGNITSIWHAALQHFSNVKKVNLPTDKTFDIYANAFKDCSLLEEIFIPDNVSSIDGGAFNDRTKLKFTNGLNIDKFVSLTTDNGYIGKHKLYTLSDDSYYIEQDDKTIKITRKEIDKFNHDSNNINVDPAPFLAFTRLIKKYNIKDKYLSHGAFIMVSDTPLLEEMFRVYDANIKRVLKLSQVISNDETSIQNLRDLLILMKITGALEVSSIIRQKATTFISEKIFEERLPNGKANEYRIVENDIHRVFNFQNLREEFDQEFALFFLENYHELVKEERRKSGFIQRVYTNFRQISKTCTSNKGSQRKLKVTIDKCKNYLTNVKFDGVTKENKKLADLIGEWYDDNNTWLNAQQIYNESLTAPRNIFTEIEVDTEGKPIYDMNEEHDLKENVSSNFSYHWLPKQDYDNLILGKYCNCCAHIAGAGQGIMRASMILDNCQNLVIRNNFGEIIAKSTIYVNKEQGYAVFNNVESSFNYRDNDSILKIYKAFLRGAKAFIKTYNENNPESPIMNISIGASRNTILDFLTDENNHPEVQVQKSLEFGKYSLNGSGYAGDWKKNQRLVLKKEM